MHIIDVNKKLKKTTLSLITNIIKTFFLITRNFLFENRLKT